MKTYTIRDIAQIANVSVTTVSRVVNKRPDVSPATRERVLDVISSCNFVCNANAKNLKQTENQVVSIIVRGHSNTFLNGVAEAILKHGAEDGLDFLVEYIDEEDDEFLTACRLRTEKHVNGFIMLGANLDDRRHAIHELDVPFVFATVNADGCGLPRVSSVSVDDRAMGRLAIEKLLAAGHEQIAIFGGARNVTDCFSLRYEGALEAFSAVGKRFNTDLYVETRFSLDGAYSFAKTFFSRHPEITAVFAMSDLVAFGVIRALIESGRHVPQDVSVIGFDGIEMGRYFVPSVTTIRQPVEEIARQSVEVLNRMLSDMAYSSHLLIPADFVERESIALRATH